MHFLDNLEGENQKVFDNKEQPVQALKHSFLGNLLSWSSMHIEVGSLSLIDFVDWVGS